MTLNRDDTRRRAVAVLAALLEEFTAAELRSMLDQLDQPERGLMRWALEQTDRSDD